MSEANTSFNIIIEEQITKLTNVQSGIKLLLERIKDADMISKLKTKQDELLNFMNKLLKLKDALNYQVNLCSDIKNISGTLSLLIQQFANTNDDNSEENQNVNESPKNNYNRASSEQTPNSNSSSYYTPVENNIYNDIRPMKPTSLNINFIEIESLTQEEYATLPKYMVGRITLDNINKFIDVINKTLSLKYSILSKPKSSLRGSDLQLYRDYKTQETEETKGKCFVTECDIAKQLNKKNLEKSSYNLLVILRHIKRLQENRSAHVLRFILNQN